jgi:hypothetical protein
MITAVVAAAFAVFGYTLWLTAIHVSARAALEANLDVIVILPFVVVRRSTASKPPSRRWST